MRVEIIVHNDVTSDVLLELGERTFSAFLNAPSLMMHYCDVIVFLCLSLFSSLVRCLAIHAALKSVISTLTVLTFLRSDTSRIHFVSQPCRHTSKEGDLSLYHKKLSMLPFCRAVKYRRV